MLPRVSGLTLTGFLMLAMVIVSPRCVDAQPSTDAPLLFGDEGALNPIQGLQQQFGYVWHSLQAPVSGIQVVVHYLPGDENWADRTMQSALTTLPILEHITGAPLPIRENIHVWEVHLSDLGLAGQNIRGLGILLAREQDVMIHELAHFWVGSHNLAEHWMAEGLAELYDHRVRLVLQGRPWSPPDLRDLRALHAFDGPLALWHRLDQVDATVQEREVNRFFYGKGFLFWYSLERTYGRDFIRDIYRWIRRAQRPRTAEDLLAFVSARSNRKLPSIWELFPGWLVGGEYNLSGKHYSFEWFLGDDDEDGVCNLEEQIAGLDPTKRDSDGDGFGDGWELFEGRNPKVPEPQPHIQATWVIPQWSVSSSHRFVRAGERIGIHAQGLWRMARPVGLWYGPRGMEGDPDPDQRWGELLGQIGLGAFSGRVHRIGDQNSFVADRDGILYFMARGEPLKAGRGGILVRVTGGRRLPSLEKNSPSLLPKARIKLARELREASITELELKGSHITLVLHPSDLVQLRDPNQTLDYLDRVYEAYVAMLGEAPYHGRRLTVAFDVTTRERIQFTGSSMAMIFGLDHLRALYRHSEPCRAMWGLTYGLARPFLEWFQADTLLEPKAVWAMSELMAAHFFHDEQVEVPLPEFPPDWGHERSVDPNAGARLRNDKRYVWSFLSSLKRDFGWSPFQRTFESHRALELANLNELQSDVPLEDFLIEFARATGYNLSTRYRAWGVPVTGRLKQVLGTLPSPRVIGIQHAP